MEIIGYIEPLAQTYADGTAAVELYLSGPGLSVLPQPAGEPVAFELRVGSQRFSAYLRAYPRTGQIYVTPTLFDHFDNRRTTLGRVLADAGLAARQTVELSLLANDPGLVVLDLATAASA
jgi:hypothetical protein